MVKVIDRPCHSTLKRMVLRGAVHKQHAGPIGVLERDVVQTGSDLGGVVGSQGVANCVVGGDSARAGLHEVRQLRQFVVVQRQSVAAAGDGGQAGASLAAGVRRQDRS